MLRTIIQKGESGLKLGWFFFQLWCSVHYLVQCSWNTYKLSSNQYSRAYTRWLWGSKYSLILVSLSFWLSHISHISNRIRQFFTTLCISWIAYSAFIHKPIPRKHWYFSWLKLKIHIHTWVFAVILCEASIRY